MINFFSTFAKACFEPRIYAKVARTWRWKAVAYFFVLSLISCVGACFMASSYVDEFYENQLMPAMPILESAKLKGSQIVTPDNKDLKLVAKDGKTFALISPKFVDVNKMSDLLFAFEKNRLTLCVAGGEFSTPLDSGQMFGKDEITLAEIFPPKEVVKFFIFPVTFFAMSALINLSYLAMLMLATCVMSMGHSQRLSMGQCFRVALLAMTPSIFIEFIVMIVFGASMSGFVYAIVSGSMIMFALNYMRKNPEV